MLYKINSAIGVSYVEGQPVIIGVLEGELFSHENMLGMWHVYNIATGLRVSTSTDLRTEQEAIDEAGERLQLCGEARYRRATKVP